MCGIFGFNLTATTSHDMASKKLNEMSRLQLHRGPDGKGEYIDNNFALGMRRLSIIDIDHGNQPFFSQNRDIVVFCNGEIYNHKKLQTHLASKGIILRSRSDVAVIPHLYALYGINALDMLNGMFALCIYDKKNGELILARDRLGVKPLYFYRKNGNFIFSSEMKSILAHEIDRSLNYDALSTYLDIGFSPAPYTPFRYINKVKSGFFIRLKNGTLSSKTYYENTPNEMENDKKILRTRIKTNLERAIKLQMTADVPIGAFLSGGTDSAGVVSYASHLTSDKFPVFHTFWNGAEEKVDERPYAKQIAEKNNLNYFEHNINDELLKSIPKLIWHLEEPISDGAFIPTFAISKIASESVKVILSGAGGDEVFGGYSHYVPKNFWRNLYYRSRYGRDYERSYYSIYKDANSKTWRDLFPWYVESNPIAEELDDFYIKHKSSSKSQKIMDLDVMHYLQENILLLTDKMSMAASVEVRVPLLDIDLVECGRTIPLNYKITKNGSKIIFKEILSERLSSRILFRKKEGYGVPVRTWVNKYRNHVFDEYFADSALAQNGMIHIDKFKRLLPNNRNLNQSESWIYWKVMIFELWFKKFYE